MTRIPQTLVVALFSLGLVACAKPAPAPTTPSSGTNAYDVAVGKIAAAIAEINAKLDDVKSDMETIKSRSSTARPDPALERIERRLARIEQLTARGAKPRPAPRRQPDPSVVYAVPLAGSPSTGPRHALVTMVMAFEFA